MLRKRKMGILLMVIMTLSSAFCEKFPDFYGTSECMKFKEYSPEFDSKERENIDALLEEILDDCMKFATFSDSKEKERFFTPRQIIETFAVRGCFGTCENLQPSYLIWKYDKCAQLVMKNTDTLDSFEFELTLGENLKEANTIFEKVFLTARNNNYVPKLGSSVCPIIPKSIVREFSYKTGLYDYIQNNLKDDHSSDLEYAIQFFGSDERFKQLLTDYLDLKQDELFNK